MNERIPADLIAALLGLEIESNGMSGADKALAMMMESKDGRLREAVMGGALDSPDLTLLDKIPTNGNWKNPAHLALDAEINGLKATLDTTFQQLVESQALVKVLKKERDAAEVNIGELQEEVAQLEAENDKLRMRAEAAEKSRDALLVWVDELKADLRKTHIRANSLSSGVGGIIHTYTKSGRREAVVKSLTLLLEADERRQKGAEEETADDTDHSQA